VVNGIFETNFGSVGGAVYCSGAGATPLIVNCTMTRSTGGPGGGMFVTEGADPIVRNCIFSRMGGIAIFEDDELSDPEITNCLFHTNTGGDYRDFDTLQTYTGANDINILVEGSTVENNFSGDPRFRFDQEFLTRVGRTANGYDFDEARRWTTFGVEDGDLVPGSLAGQLVEISGYAVRARIVDNSANRITIEGNQSPANGFDISIVDYDLITSSAATDRGDELDAPGFDIARRIRPIDVAGVGFDGPHRGYDIGAYEFAGETGEIVVTTFPEGAPWRLTFSNGLLISNSGNWELKDVPAGTVRIDWLPLAGYVAPAPRQRTLTQGSIVRFTGVYTQVGDANAQLATEILYYLLGITSDPTGLDLNGDGQVNSADLVMATNGG
jgi:hypothetical protein